MAVTTEPPWRNFGSGVADRNGTTTHTIGASGAATTPSSGGTLSFTPAAGSLLVAITSGGVTHTSSGTGAGAGWTERQSPVNSQELSLFTKTGDGNDFLTITHNGSNYPIAWAFYEFPSGSTYTNSSSATANNNTFPALGSLPGTAQVVIAALCCGQGVGTGSGGSTVSGSWVEDVDSLTPYASSTEGTYLHVFHQINVTATSITPTSTFGVSGTALMSDRQKVVGAFNVAVAAATNTSAFFAMF